MQQEDDLRGLAKVMEFMRAISIIFIVVHIYWFCYQAIVDMGINIGVVDKILLNFQNTAGLFSNLLVTKVFAIIFLALSCLGTKGVKNQKMTWQKIYPRRSCTLLYELVVARTSVLANREYGNLYHYDNSRIYPSAYVGSMD